MYNVVFYEKSDGSSELWELLESLRSKMEKSKSSRIQYKLTGTEPTPPDSAPFRRFSPFFLCRAPALRHQKSRKSIKNCLLTGASSFAGADFSTGKAKPAANT